MIVRALTFIALIIAAFAGVSSAQTQTGSAWILWEKTYTTKGTATPTTMWEPYDGYSTLGECRKAALPLVQYALDYVKSSLKSGLRWVRQEPNRDSLWNAIKFNSVNPFLAQLWRQGAFGTGTPAQTYTVICDASNNPPDQVDQGNLKVEVYFYPSKPAETIIIIVGQQPSGATVAEA